MMQLASLLRSLRLVNLGKFYYLFVMYILTGVFLSGGGAGTHTDIHHTDEIA